MLKVAILCFKVVLWLRLTQFANVPLKSPIGMLFNCRPRYLCQLVKFNKAGELDVASILMLANIKKLKKC